MLRGQRTGAMLRRCKCVDGSRRIGLYLFPIGSLLPLIGGVTNFRGLMLVSSCLAMEVGSLADSPARFRTAGESTATAKRRQMVGAVCWSLHCKRGAANATRASAPGTLST
jgi:hypothetical protein